MGSPFVGASCYRRAAFFLPRPSEGRGLGWALYQDMGNTLMPPHRLHFSSCSGGCLALVDRWTHRSRILVVQVSDQKFSQINSLHLAFDGLQTDPMSDEGFADKSFSSSPFDFSVAADLPLRPSCRMAQGRSWIGCARQTLAIPASRHFLPQGLMRTNLVVVPDPTGGAVLLPPASRGHGPGRFRFEHAMHLFVSPVVFRVSRP